MDHNFPQVTIHALFQTSPITLSTFSVSQWPKIHQVEQVDNWMIQHSTNRSSHKNFTFVTKVGYSLWLGHVWYWEKKEAQNRKNKIK